MAMNRNSVTTINGYRFSLTQRFLKCGLGKFKLSNHSGLGNVLSKAGFSQAQVKQVYALLRSA